MPDSVTTKTTTLVIEKPDSFEKLAEKYCLMRYVVPDSFALNRDNGYKRLHIATKTQLRVPYFLYTHDRLSTDGRERSAIYALFQRKREVPIGALALKEPSITLAGNEIAFETLGRNFHVLVKLLQMDYARFDSNAFTAVGDYYIHAKGAKNVITCLQVEIKGDSRNVLELGEARQQSFKVIGHATRLIRRQKKDMKPHYKFIYPYFRREPKNSQHLYSQLLREEIDSYEGEIFSAYKQSDERAQLNFHSNTQPEYTRGKILFDFTNNFIKHLDSLGIRACHDERVFDSFKASTDSIDLPVKELGCIYLFDNRRNQTEVLISYFHDLLCKYPSAPNFEIIQDLRAGLEYPILILQDHEKGDFEEGGDFYGQPDPYQEIRRNPDLIDLPKQSIHVKRFAPTNEQHHTDEILHPIAVCLNELYLKYFILRNQPIVNSLPNLFQDKHGHSILLSQFAFVRQANYGDKGRYGVLAWVVGENLHFEDIGAPAGREVLNNLLVNQGLPSFDEILIEFAKRNRKKKQDTNEWNFDFVIGPGFVAEIEDINERVLYDYETIMQRKHSVAQEIPLEEFLLAQHYEQLRHTGWPDLAQLEMNSSSKPTKAQRAASKFLSCLQEFDDYLINEVGQFRFDLSFSQLTSSPEWTETIAAIFNKGIEENTRRVIPETVGSTLKREYQKLGMFLSTKSTVDVLKLYQGIWYDAANRYMVGATQNLNDKQARAHLIRQFNVYFGQENFDILPLLDMMAVKFVRHQQFTVYPFPFHLIDLYVENKLRYLE